MNTEKLEYVSTLYLNCSDRQVNEPINNFRLVGQNRLDRIDYITVYKYQFTNNIYPVNDTNNTLHFIFNGIAYDIQLATSNYTGVLLASALQTAILAQITPITDFTVVFDPNTLKLTFNSTAYNFRFIVGLAYQNNLGQVLGFIIDNKDSANFDFPQVSTNNVVSAYPVNIQSTRYVDICSNFLTQYVRSGPTSGNSYGRILKRIHFDEPFGYEEVLPIKNLELLDWKNELAVDGNIDIQVYNDQGRLADLTNSKFNLQIACYRKCKY